MKSADKGSDAGAARRTLEPRETALSQVEHDTAGQQERIHRQVVREGQEQVADPATLTDKVARDTARYEALAREHGADLSEEGFNEALRKVSRNNPSN